MPNNNKDKDKVIPFLIISLVIINFSMMKMDFSPLGLEQQEIIKNNKNNSNNKSNQNKLKINKNLKMKINKNKNRLSKINSIFKNNSNKIT